MGWETDSKFSLRAKYSQSSNGHLYNTPILTFTIGMDCILNWKRRYIKVNSNGQKSWCVEKENI